MKPRRKRSPTKSSSAKIVSFPQHSVVRLSRVAEARRRIESGWYDRAEVRSRLVEAVLQEIRTR
jgi:hypothetical protein